ncbi:MAG TPA: L-2-hydroxyglutarate oxidase [Melioribacteraceae bacterium]|nr:L-2-hydroxyglutarate oxidase [Melioribacteraceae bacterium]
MYDFIIIGAGIVGLATGMLIKEKFPTASLLILEKEDNIAKHQTGNNSGVIHSGIYYKPNSLKAKNCLEGYKLLLEFCNNNNIKYEICGKLIIAVNKKEEVRLLELYKRGIENGLEGLKILNSDEIKKYEPFAKGIRGLYVPQTGIIDYKEVSEAYKKSILNNKGEILFNQKVINIFQENGIVTVKTLNQTNTCKQLITCCGLYSDEIAKLTEFNVDFRIIPFRGEYYSLKSEACKKINNLIYPVPNPNFPFLGVHFTRKLNGGCEAGPNAVLSFKKEGYKKTDFNFIDTFNIFAWKGFRKVLFKNLLMGFAEFYRSFNKFAFTKALKKLVPGIQISDLINGGSGVRAQACSDNGILIDDFYIIKSKSIIHVCNAPSPAATASLAIARHIIEKL